MSTVPVLAKMQQSLWTSCQLSERFHLITLVASNKDALECLWSMIRKVGEANQIDIVLLFSYVENSIKESTKASRSNAVEPVEYVNILLESSLPAEVGRF